MEQRCAFFGPKTSSAMASRGRSEVGRLSCGGRVDRVKAWWSSHLWLGNELLRVRSCVSCERSVKERSSMYSMDLLAIFGVGTVLFW